jgi:hypothetical protein
MMLREGLCESPALSEINGDVPIQTRKKLTIRSPNNGKRPLYIPYVFISARVLSDSLLFSILLLRHRFEEVLFRT